MKGHVILLGLGHVGFRVFQLLRRLGEQVSVIDSHAAAEWKALVENAGGVFYEGDACDQKLLRKAGIEGAKALMALTDQELVNLSAAMDAREINPSINIIIRLFDQELARHLKQAFDIQTVLSTSAITAPLFAAAVAGERSLACFSIQDRSYAVMEGEIAVNSPLEGQSVEAFEEREKWRPAFVLREGKLITDLPEGATLKSGDLLLGLRVETASDGKNNSSTYRQPWYEAFFTALQDMPRAVNIAVLALAFVLISGIPIFRYGLDISWLDACYFAVTTLTTVGFGDISLLKATWYVKLFGTFYMFAGAALLAASVGIVTDYLLSLRLRELLGLQSGKLHGHVILVGAGNLGSRIAEELLELGKTLIVANFQPVDRFAHLLRSRAVLIEGDPRNREVLLRAGVTHALAVLSVTDDDVFNLSVGLLAKQLNSSIRVIIRIFDGSLAEKVRTQLNIDRVYSVSAASAPAFAAGLLDPSLVTGFVWRDYLIWIATACHSAESGREDGVQTVWIAEKKSGESRPPFRTVNENSILQTGEKRFFMRAIRLPPETEQEFESSW